jgi:phosphoenolpyruvate-protein phosphotransferase (PTS system enzyme I)
MVEFSGISASPGIVMGKVFLYTDDNWKVPKYEILEEDIPREIERFHEAVRKAEEEVQGLKALTATEMGMEEARILDAHLLMLGDPEMHQKVEQNLDANRHNVEWVVYETVTELINQLNAAKDAYLRERSIDMYDVSKRVLNHLMYRDRISLGDLSEEIVLVTHNLLPSDTLSMNKRMVRGIAMDAGGKTSHTAILARSFEIPAVLGLSTISRSVRNGDRIIVDGNRGTVIVNPDEATAKRYAKLLREWQKREIQLLTLNELPAETKDGKLILLEANIEVPEETDSVMAHGADGIGLYRSEFLFLQPSGAASEEVQYAAYSRVLRAMEGRSVTIRTLDVGGDKTVPGFGEQDEKNPILGWRAIRFCLSRQDLFKTQLKALLRASMDGNLRIMFPMISGIEELNEALEILDEVKDDCRRAGIEYKSDIPVGIMIEVPSAAMTTDILARKVNFFSIGTNDLIQYTIAVDRGNEKIAYLYEPFHPGVLRLIRTVIDNAHEQSIPVSMCGEMAGDPMASVILVGLGLDVFSMSSFGIPEVKQIIRSTNMSAAEELVGHIMEMRSYKEIDRFVRGWMHERYEILAG